MARIRLCVYRTVLKIRKSPTFVHKSFLKKCKKVTMYESQAIGIYGIREGPIPILIEVGACLTIYRQYK